MTEGAAVADIDRRGRALLLLSILLVSALYWWFRPRTLWEFDEPLFVSAVMAYDPLEHHPPPPGYPLLIGLAKLLALLLDPFDALVALSLISSMIGFAALAIAFGNITSSRTTGIAGALLFYLSPSMLVHGALPVSDATGIAFLAVALAFASRLGAASPPRTALLFGLFASAAVGCRPQLSIIVLPLLAVSLLQPISWLDRLRIAGCFTLVSAGWLIPLLIETGGISGLIRFELGQAAYFAAHDADISRSGRSIASIVVRFVAHPWGDKFLSLPLLAAAALGVVGLVRTRLRGVIPIGTAALVYLLFAIAMMDPADGVRYALPSSLALALFAAHGLAMISGSTSRIDRRQHPAVVLAALYGVASFAYTVPLLSQRSSGPSPPVAAARYAEDHLPPRTVILHELPLWPHATLLLRQFESRRIEEGLREYADRVDVPVYLYADGGNRLRRGWTFSWKESDAYGKLTRGHYRVVSLIELPANERFTPLTGVYPAERTVDGLEWRWLASEATLRLPPLDSGRVAIRLALPSDFSLASNLVEVSIEGEPAGRWEVRRGEEIDISIPLVETGSEIHFHSERSSVPAETNRLNRDPRQLAVMLVRVRLEL
ncbi:MAG TPA: hypothetical protein VMT00_12565 [Thermoanaerobaculia bacterium]|nr:hypothetical protein [Thermoanaerobaculia bacterium]